MSCLRVWIEKSETESIFPPMKIVSATCSEHAQFLDSRWMPLMTTGDNVTNGGAMNEVEAFFGRQETKSHLAVNDQNIA